MDYKEQKNKKDELFRIAITAFDDFLKVSKAALEAGNFQECTLEELRKAKKLIERAVEEGKELKTVSVKALSSHLNNCLYLFKSIFSNKLLK